MLQCKTTCEGLLQLEHETLESIISNKNVTDVYEMNSNTPLGRGRYATVCRAVHKKNGTHYAAKVIKKRRRNQDKMKKILHEIAVLMECSSTNRVIGLQEVYESPTEMVLILELAAGGDLQRILDSGQCLGETEARNAIRQILEGVLFLHNKNIAHLDLKPQNILLSKQESCEDIKLCDFGISKVIQPGVTLREIVGTVDYVAPEVLSYEPICLSTDIWSVGVLAYVILSGLSPFGADDKQQTFLNISKCALTFEPESFQNVSSAAIDLIQRALIVDPRKRPSVHELLHHPWISLKVSPSPILSLQAPMKITLTSSPMQQRKSLSCITESKDFQSKPKNNTLDGLLNYLCPLCGAVCRHIIQPTIVKSTISVDRRILC